MKHIQWSFCVPKVVIAFMGFLLASHSAIAQSIDIAPMTWTPRADWLNVVTVYGADPTGTADSTTAIQNALNAAAVKYAPKRTVYFPAGTYKITSTLTWGGVTSAEFVGCGRNTILKWAGASGGAMLWSTGCDRSQFIGIAWDGNNLAGCGILDLPSNHYETHLRHTNESFKNFTASGSYIAGRTGLPAAGIACGFNPGTSPTAEEFLMNCLFYNCDCGAVVGYEQGNCYMWTFKKCEFEDCGYGIWSSSGEVIASDSHFSNSTYQDILAGNTCRAHRCTSVGSGMFFDGVAGGAAMRFAVNDCWIDSWTGTTSGAVQFTDRGGTILTDNIFTHAPSTTPPIFINNSPNNPYNLFLSNNYCPTTTTLVNTPPNPSSNIITAPSGALNGVLTSPLQTFLSSTWPADSTHILDVTKAPYTADSTGVVDATATIQQAITDARTANNGSIVYFPLGGYKISSTLTVSGGNYTLEGCGYGSEIRWYGPAAGTMMSVTTPQNITIRQMTLQGVDVTTSGIVETSTGASNVVYDAIFYGLVTPGNPGVITRTNGPGLTLSNLPAGSVVSIPVISSPVVVNDCGAATILEDWGDTGMLTVKGATHPKTGFFGILVGELGNSADTTNYNININDNQDLVFGDYYDESNWNSLNLQRGSGTGSGRVTVNYIKQFSLSTASPTTVNINNYQGRVMVSAPFMYGNGSAATISQTGTNAVDLILNSIFFGCGVPPTISTTSANLIQLNDFYDLTGVYNPVYMPELQPTGWGLSTAQAYDHFRQLDAVDFSLNYGIGQLATNPSVELDAANPNPLTAIGYTPAGWTVSSALAAGGGARNLTVTSGASPFGAGAQSMLWVDTTGSTSGSSLSVNQYLTASPATSSGIMTFDFRLNASGTATDVRIRSSAGSAVSSNLRISRTGSSAGLLGQVGGREGTLTSLTVGTWYRVHVVMAAPNTTAGATVYLTPWVGTAPGATTSYSVDGVATVQTIGFNRIFLTTANGPGAAQSVNIDNMGLITNALQFNP